jgi:exopolysaccharide biosynthesis polyprenyl glycosylphosphotransferase
MDATRKQTLRRLGLTLDGFIIVASMFVAFWAHGQLREVIPVLKDPPRFHEYAALAYLTLPVWLLLILVLRLDTSFERLATWSEILLDLIKLHIVGLVALSLILFLTQSVINRSLVALFLSSTFLFLLSERLVLSRWLRYQHESGQGRTRLLLIGNFSDEMAEFAREARLDPLPPHIIGYLGPAPEGITGATGDDLPARVGSVGDLERVLHSEAVDHVLFFPPFHEPETVENQFKLLAMLGIPAAFAVKRAPFSETMPEVLAMYGRGFVTFQENPKPLDALALKYGLDVSIAAAALVLLAPIFLVLSAAILLTMGRPVLFVQERAGLYGRRFHMLKFRTMARGAEADRDSLLALNEMNGPVFKATNDPRITPVGRWLRTWSLDELPQLVNVVLGSMSLVGPRPLPIEEQQQIRGWHRRRLSMKPGMTGLWQVSGRNDVDFEEWMRLDLRYVDEWSLSLDFRILLKTFPAVLSRKGSR